MIRVNQIIGSPGKISRLIVLELFWVSFYLGCAKMHDQLHEYVGVIHIHSTYSDGTRPIPEIAQIASEVGLDFLMFTDHNTLQPKRDGMEGWYNGVLISTGYEINDADDLNHYLAFGLDRELPQVLKPLNM